MFPRNVDIVSNLGSLKEVIEGNFDLRVDVGSVEDACWTRIVLNLDAILFWNRV